MLTFYGVISDLLVRVQNVATENGWNQEKIDKTIWDIITALRGPDAPVGEGVKKAFTGKLRTAIGITEENTPRGLTLTPLDESASCVIEAGHFKDHADRATKAIEAVYGVDLSGNKFLGHVFDNNEKEYQIVEVGDGAYNAIRVSTGRKRYKDSFPSANAVAEKLMSAGYSK